jgi:hypothetical protein
MRFIDLIQLSLENKDHGEIDVNLAIEVLGDTWTAYTAHVNSRDILLYCDKGVANFLVDSYGDTHFAVYRAV